MVGGDHQLNTYMQQAWLAARQGIKAGDGGPFGAVIVRAGKVIATGHNQVLKTHDATAHAEIVAIRAANQVLGTHDLSGCEIVTTCYPCPMCFSAILWARIKNVYYSCTMEQAAAIGFDDKVFYEAILNPEHNPLISLIHCENSVCESLLTDWLKLEGHQLY
jgi:guanine deaminase